MNYLYDGFLVCVCLISLCSQLRKNHSYETKQSSFTRGQGYDKTVHHLPQMNSTFYDDDCWHEYYKPDFQPIKICYRNAKVTNTRTPKSLGNHTNPTENYFLHQLTSTSQNDQKMTSQKHNNNNNGTTNKTGDIEADDRVINGFTVDIRDHPWMVSLEMCFGSMCKRCGGTIIDKNAVLTAAHCVKDEMCNGEIYVGNRIRKQGTRYIFSCQSSVVFLSEEYDLALIFPTGDVQLKEPAISLPVDESEQPEKHDRVYVLGWGRICDTDGECLSQSHSTDALNGVVLVVHTSDEHDCNYKDPLFCAGGMDEGIPRDSCVGDLGGPLECRDKNGRVYLCGVVSKGPAPPNCGRKPGAYVKVAHRKVLKWLKDNGINTAYQNRTPVHWDMADRFADTATLIKSTLIPHTVIVFFFNMIPCYFTSRETFSN
ncbi:chymotrypsin-like elastase family member 1 [Convolutriloba macropyga]|uniref:chymotrypsin-like elastase family member 1 n=1 Tax=Convolutriloba macropyga TaxID=536237 RepID=UPI003F520B6D